MEFRHGGPVDVVVNDSKETKHLEVHVLNEDGIVVHTVLVGRDAGPLDISDALITQAKYVENQLLAGVLNRASGVVPGLDE